MSLWRVSRSLFRRSSFYAYHSALLRSSKGAAVASVSCSRDISSSSYLLRPVVPFNLPDVGEAIMTVVVKEWMVQPGDSVKMGDEICEVQSDKSSATIYSPFDGVIKELMYKVDEVAQKDEPLVMIDVSSEDVSSEQSQLERTSEVESRGVASSQPSMASAKVLATPAVRKMAAENNIDLGKVTGSGKDGRVLKEDLISFIEEMKAPPKVMEPPVPATPFTSAVPSTEVDRVEPIKGYRMIMVQTMTTSGQIPQFGYCDEIEMNQLMSVRTQLRDLLAEKGIRFSYMPLMIKALSLALREYPVLNAHVNADCTQLIYKSDHNIGVAVDTPQGLVVPNIKQVQNKSVLEVASELNHIHDLSLKGGLSPTDIKGGTFSLSNIGPVGGTYTRPLLLPPEVCIGAFGKIQEVPRFDPNRNVRRSHVMYASWSADHRVIDGATVARFSNLWKSYLENPTLMIAELK